MPADTHLYQVFQVILSIEYEAEKMNVKQKTKKHFNETACDYDNSRDGKFVEPMYEIIAGEIQKSPSGRILDVGCGNANLFSMLPDGKYELHGIDFCENMIAEALMKCGNKAEFKVADAEKLPFDDDSFDVIVCNASFHHYVRPGAVLEEMHRVLKDGGRLLIGDPYLPNLVRPIFNMLLRFSDSGDYHIYGFDEMERLFVENGFIHVSSMKTEDHAAFHVAKKR